MSDNQEKLLNDLRNYIKLNLDTAPDEEIHRVLQNIMNFVILIEDDE